jgi:hypothetical protein
MDPENERIRGYLQSQAGSKGVDVLVERVREGIADLETAARAVPDEAFEAIPPEDSWSPRDCLTHAVGSNMGIGAQILHVAWTGALPESNEAEVPEDAEGMLARHGEAMESLYVHVLEADPEANLEVKWEHPQFGPLNWREWLLFLRIHSKDHAQQLSGMTKG